MIKEEGKKMCSEGAHGCLRNNCRCNWTGSGQCVRNPHINAAKEQWQIQAAENACKSTLV